MRASLALLTPDLLVIGSTGRFPYIDPNPKQFGGKAAELRSRTGGPRAARRTQISQASLSGNRTRSASTTRNKH